MLKQSGFVALPAAAILAFIAASGTMVAVDQMATKPQAQSVSPLDSGNKLRQGVVTVDMEPAGKPGPLGGK